MHQQKLDLNALLDAGSSSKPIKQSTPRRSRRKWHTALLGALFLAAGFAAGFFAYDLLHTPPAAPPPAEPTSPQPNYGHGISTQQLISSYDGLNCYLYTEKPDYIPYTLDDRPHEVLFTLTDNNGTYKLKDWPLAIRPNLCNFFLRVDLTEAGKNRLDLNAFDILVNGYIPEYSDVPYLHMGIARFFDGNGFFVVGYLSQTVELELQYRKSDSPEPSCIVFSASPIQQTIGDSRVLVELALAADEQVWTGNNGGLPETFEKGTMFAQILEKDDCIDCLLQYAASTDRLQRERSRKLLAHPAFQVKMNEMQQTIFQDMIKCINIVRYTEPVILMTTSESGAPIGPPYFLAFDGRWSLCFDTTQWLQDTPQEHNFFTRLELSDFARLHYDPQWTIEIAVDSNGGENALGIRKYYVNGNVAGWFLYGYAEKPVQLQITLYDINGNLVYATNFRAAPIAGTAVPTPSS